MALGATQDHKDSAVLVEADLKELAESLGQILRLLAALVAQDLNNQSAAIGSHLRVGLSTRMNIDLHDEILRPYISNGPATPLSRFRVFAIARTRVVPCNRASPVDLTFGSVHQIRRVAFSGD